MSLDGLDFTTNFTAALSCLSNVGPGLSLVGPTGSFAIFSPLSKIVLMICMLLGRLEIFLCCCCSCRSRALEVSAARSRKRTLP